MKEIQIIADATNSSLKGKFYEDLMNAVFKTQRFKVQGNINFTGMEFDLLCTHIDRENEKALVECKAKDSISSDEITKFAFNVQHKKLDYGFFIYTKSYIHQVAGIIEELKNDIEKRYRNLYFWDAEKAIELLVASGLISECQTKFTDFRTTKSILLYSYFGTYYVLILSNSTIPEYFSMIDANNLKRVVDIDVIEKVRENVKETQSLKYYSDEIDDDEKEALNTRPEIQLETIAEIQSSDSWFDYKPASRKYFVGRTDIENELFSWFENVLGNTTNKRVFYLDGKSGLGKSSLLNAIKGRSRNKYHKSKYYSLVIDSRSGNSQNFIPLAFSMLLEKAVKDKYLPGNFEGVKIESIYNILQSTEVIQVTDFLKDNNKLLILVFDQFEDIFRKGNIFNGFYKLLIDVANMESNICLGFSWKSEVNIPLDHNAYFLWQQMKDYAYTFTLSQFSSNESKKIVSQLESAINSKLDTDFVRKIIDNSQGFPWLVKKLCVHIFNQFNKGVSLKQLYNQDFNVEILFKEDCENLSKDELRALRYIAKKAYDNDMVDEIEIADIVDTMIKEELLLNKRMIIKSGTKYNIYWDIFRDYLVTEEVPIVGETYIFRQHPSTVLEVFLYFNDSWHLTIEDILEKSSNLVAKKTEENILRELRTIGLVIYEDEEYRLRNKEMKVDLESFKMYMKEKLTKHSFVLSLLKINERDIELSDIIGVIKTLVRSEAFSLKTLETYAQIFISWIYFVDYGSLHLNPKVRIRAENSITYTPQYDPMKLMEYFSIIKDMQEIDIKNKGLLRALYDLKSFGFLFYNSSNIFLTSLGKQAKGDMSIFKKELYKNALTTQKINMAYSYFIKNSDYLSFMHEAEEMLAHINSSVYKNATMRILYNWAVFISECKKDITTAST